MHDELCGIFLQTFFTVDLCTEGRALLRLTSLEDYADVQSSDSLGRDSKRMSSDSNFVSWDAFRWIEGIVELEFRSLGFLICFFLLEPAV
jgi:hypothetical protein